MHVLALDQTVFFVNDAKKKMSYDDKALSVAETLGHNRLDALLRPIVGNVSDRKASGYQTDDSISRS